MLPITSWKLPQINHKHHHRLTKELGVHPIICHILINRNIPTPEDAFRFFSPSLKDLSNPFLMQDMDKAIERILKAISEKEKITVFGDYDADGITSTAILVKFLGDLNTDVDYYIPDRIREGYGLNKEAIDNIAGKGSRLLITVDCGIANYEEIDYASVKGMDTIVLDHHEVPDRLPRAIAAVNPNRPDCRFPFKHLAGVGVAFNFLIALRSKLRSIGFWKNRNYPNLKDYLDVVALGTIGDMSPLIGENRIFAKIGLEIINEGKRTGLRALQSSLALGNKAIDSETASYHLIPRLNAAGRVGSPHEAVQLLLTEDMATASRIAAKLNQYNLERRNLEQAILHDLLQEIGANIDLNRIKSLVFASYRWHPGVIGIVASRLVERYNRPTFLISLKNGIGRGSGRSITAFNLYEGLKTACAPLLISYGGHRFAAGISIREEDISSFSATLNTIIEKNVSEEDFVPQTFIDACCNLNEVDHNLVAQLGMLSPFGTMNPEPVLCARNITVTSPTLIKNNHIKMRVRGNGMSYDSIWFSKGHYLPRISSSEAHIVFTPRINRWNNDTNIQLKLKDMTVAATQ